MGNHEAGASVARQRLAGPGGDEKAKTHEGETSGAQGEVRARIGNDPLAECPDVLVPIGRHRADAGLRVEGAGEKRRRNECNY